jgi:stage V sporulation protein R
MEDLEIKELEKSLERIWEVARGFGLDPYPVRFEVVPATVMYEIGSYALPGRYSHWTFGKAYHRMKTMYDFGLSKIYEVVINTNPSYGFLLETNSPVQNKLVMAHVLGHVDFFKHNAYFSRTNRRMVETVSAHAGRMSEYEFRYGRKAVERLLDAVLSIEEHIDPNFFIRRDADASSGEMKKKPVTKPGRYDDLWNIGRVPEEDSANDEDERPRGERLPEKDLVYYITRNSPSLKEWERDVMAMVHEEMEYFVPQMQTKTLNEGWASFWHSRIMRELDLPDEELLEFAELHSGVVSPQKGQLNPYYLGTKSRGHRAALGLAHGRGAREVRARGRRGAREDFRGERA